MAGVGPHSGSKTDGGGLNDREHSNVTEVTGNSQMDSHSGETWEGDWVGLL